MKVSRTDLTADLLRDALDYDPETGAFVRKIRIAQSHRVGDRADRPITAGGTLGYRRVAIYRVQHLAHRLAWLHFYGEWPVGDIDHINGNRDDNRISNLRDVPHAVNGENRRKPHRNNVCGLLGVGFFRGKWRARISYRGALHALGSFDRPEQAHNAYIEAKRLLHKGCTI
jgi:hypothetical protein